jgi:hypothetical protein
LQASLASSFENVSQLLQYEALVNTFDKTNGSSPLHDACFAGALKYVRVLNLRCAVGIVAALVILWCQACPFLVNDICSQPQGRADPSADSMTIPAS